MFTYQWDPTDQASFEQSIELLPFVRLRFTIQSLSTIGWINIRKLITKCATNTIYLLRTNKRNKNNYLVRTNVNPSASNQFISNNCFMHLPVCMYTAILAQPNTTAMKQCKKGITCKNGNILNFGKHPIG